MWEKDTERKHPVWSPCLVNLDFVGVERWQHALVNRTSAWILKNRSQQCCLVSIFLITKDILCFLFGCILDNEKEKKNKNKKIK